VGGGSAWRLIGRYRQRTAIQLGNSMSRRKERGFGQMIRDRRRQLDLTQQDVAQRIKTSTPYVGHLESGKRHPSQKVVSRLAEVLGLEQRELFFLANPGALEMLRADRAGKRPAWEEFRKDERLRRLHNVTNDEMEMLSRVALMGEIGSPRDFIYILQTVRHALGR
jgi:transcriptional regulator with XRE-family HTH domain